MPVPARWRRSVAAVVIALAVIFTAVGPGEVVSGLQPPDDAAAAVGPPSSTAAAEVTVEQQRTGNVFLANQTARLDVVSTADRVVWALEVYGGRRVANGTLSVGGRTTFEPPVEGVGHYQLHLWTAGSDAVDASTSLAVLPTEKPPTDAFYGMDFQRMERGPQSGTDRWDLADRAGVTSIRVHHDWHEVETERGTYDFVGAPRRPGVRTTIDRPFDVLYHVAFGNTLYGDRWNDFPASPTARRASVNYSVAATREYDPDHVEVYNEPNLETFSNAPGGASPRAYARLLAATHAAIDDRWPEKTVVGGSTAADRPAAPRIDYPFWRGILDNGSAQHMDAMSVHLYRDRPTNFASDLGRLRSLTREHNGGETLPIWATEIGWNTHDHTSTVTEPTQARYVVYSHVRLQNADVQRTYWFTFRDISAPGDADPWHQSGLLRAPDHPMGGSTPKPGFTAYATMTRQLAGLDHVRNGSAPSGISSHTYGHGDDRTRVLWSGRNTAVTDVTVATDGPVEVTTTTGQSHTLQPHDGEVYLTVGPDPLYLDGPVTGITEGAPVSLASTGADVTVAAEGSGAPSYTYAFEGRRVTVEGGSERRVSLPTAYRPYRPAGERVVYVDDGQRVDAAVAVDGQQVGLLSAWARPDPVAPAPPTAGTSGAGTGTTTTGADPTAAATPTTPRTAAATDGGPESPTGGSGPGFGVAGLVVAVVALATLVWRW